MVLCGEWIREEFIANDGQNVRHFIHSPGPLRDKNGRAGTKVMVGEIGKSGNVREQFNGQNGLGLVMFR